MRYVHKLRIIIVMIYKYKGELMGDKKQETKKERRARKQEKRAKKRENKGLVAGGNEEQKAVQDK